MPERERDRQRKTDRQTLKPRKIAFNRKPIHQPQALERTQPLIILMMMIFISRVSFHVNHAQLR